MAEFVRLSLVLPFNDTLVLSHRIEIDGEPILWDGWRAIQQIRASEDEDAEVLAEIRSDGDDPLIVLESPGRIVRTFTPVSVADVPRGRSFPSDLLFIQPSGGHWRPLRYSARVGATISQDGE